VVCGIPGSGKSTLCRLLCAAFESSTWLNQDHFPSGPRARLQFLRGVQNSLDAAMHSRRSALVCVDKVNVQKVHREGFWQQAEEVGWKEGGGITIFCELCELSSPGNLLRHCQSRIEHRGPAHNSLHPSPQLPVILDKHLQSWEPLDEEELSRFDAHVRIDVSFRAVDKAMQVITALRRLGWCPRLRSLASASPASDEWVAFPRLGQPTYYWNRRTGESVWQVPEAVEPAWTGYRDGDHAFFRCAHTSETLWQLPPLASASSAPAPSASQCSSAEDQLKHLLEAEWARLQGREESIRRDALSTPEKPDCSVNSPVGQLCSFASFQTIAEHAQALDL